MALLRVLNPSGPSLLAAVSLADVDIDLSVSEEYLRLPSPPIV
jgi:hypothetical protein